MWKKLKALFTKKKPQLIIYHVHEGPMHVDDMEATNCCSCQADRDWETGRIETIRREI